ncbi:MAG: ferritin family protein [Bacteroidales bacterium]|nr:ferritin family protein [Bacteroidales bacterium]MDY0216498.1 ferritin family protein [Bacteroidales bacterium]
MENKSLEILKMAILLERRGKEFYNTVAGQTKNEQVKKIFTLMAKEEDLHLEQLSQQYKEYRENGKFIAQKLDVSDNEESIANFVLNPEVRKNLSAASYEAAAINAAIDMENKAIEVYSQRAEEATDPNEKELYTWLANFERDHHKILHRLNKELMEEIWYDNSFWPF